MNTVDKLSTAELKELLRQKEAEEQKEILEAKKKYQTEKENFLNDIASKFKEVNQILSILKTEAIEISERLNLKKYDLEGKAAKDTKQFELKNDEIKIIVANQELFDFNDEAVVHINTIREIFKEKFENRNKGMYALLDGILMKNGKGEYDAKLLTKARRQVKEIGDEKLIEVFDKLSDCLVVVGSAKYVRVYSKDDKNRWKDISLNFSSL